MHINYDILEQEDAAFFDVALNLIHNGRQINFTTAIGDYGNLTSSGMNKAIAWKFKNDFQGNIAEVVIEVLARMIPNPKASYEFDIIGRKPPFQVLFRNLSENSDSFTWDFDDPGSGPSNYSNLKNPEHMYMRARVYSVGLLAVSESTGISDSVRMEVKLNLGELPVAKFKYNLSSKTAPATAWFKNTSANSDEYHWNFGDPDSGSKNYSAKKNPVHIFSRPGEYQVVLTVSNTKSMESHSHTKDLVVSSSR